MKILEHQIVQFWSSSSWKSAASESARLNSAKSNSETLEVTTSNGGASLMQNELLLQLNIIVFIIMCCFMFHNCTAISRMDQVKFVDDSL